MRNTKPAPSARIKLKLTLGLLGLAMALLIANKYERERVDRMDAAYRSIYEDRLVPATCIFEIQEKLYRKQELLQRLLTSNSEDH
ncbi:MAG: MCP four helix bundle domain-containing protein, partial [Saprospiraceae bacterium]